MLGNAACNHTETGKYTRGTPGSRECPAIASLSSVRLLHRSDERPPGTGGNAQRLPVTVLGVSHDDGLGSTGDFYALATVRT